MICKLQIKVFKLLLNFSNILKKFKDFSSRSYLISGLYGRPSIKNLSLSLEAPETKRALRFKEVFLTQCFILLPLIFVNLTH